MPSRSVLVATTNPGKVREITQILEPLGWIVRSLDSLPGVIPEPEEDQPTFRGNARLKARYYARVSGIDCLAEDSGLEVDALGGAPGVHSARFAGVEGTREQRDLANNEKLLGLMRGIPKEQRTARFVCAMCLARPDGSVIVETEGRYEGLVAEEPRGGNGFGYDPLLLLQDVGCTSAELSSDEKNARSHRGKAARALAAALAADRPGE